VKRAHYNAKMTRDRLLESSLYIARRVVRVLYRPFDVRWLYWEPDGELLNRPRRELIPYWADVPGQRCLVLPQTPRRAGALRPVVSYAVGYFAAAEPDARIFPLYRPQILPQGQAVGEPDLNIPRQAAGGPDVNIPRQAAGGPDLEILTSESHGHAGTTMVAPDWVAAANSALSLADDTAAGEAVFFALVAVMHSPAWLSRQPAELDDFPEVPLPGESAALARAAEIGRQIADLTDPTVPVYGVTTGRIDALVAGLGVPDTASGMVTLEYGTEGRRGGLRRGADVLWSSQSGWRDIPDNVWAYRVCGFPVLPKWLSYRVSTGLTDADREYFMLMVRRIAILLQLQGSCDEAYIAAVEQPLEVSTAGVPAGG
jgi:Type ISP C-terminal specificity domain